MRVRVRVRVRLGFSIRVRIRVQKIREHSPIEIVSQKIITNHPRKSLKIKKLNMKQTFASIHDLKMSYPQIVFDSPMILKIIPYRW